MCPFLFGKEEDMKAGIFNKGVEAGMRVLYIEEWKKIEEEVLHGKKDKTVGLPL